MTITLWTLTNQDQESSSEAYLLIIHIWNLAISHFQAECYVHIKHYEVCVFNVRLKASWPDRGPKARGLARLPEGAHLIHILPS